MNKQLSKPPDDLIERGKQHLQVYQLEEALEVLKHSLLERQLKEGADLPFHGQLLWCTILLTKGRFSGDQSLSKTALHKLEELRSLLPPTIINTAPIPLTLLLSQAHYQVGNIQQAERLANQLALFSKTSQYIIGEVEAYNALGHYALHQQQIEEALGFARKAQALLIHHTSINVDQVLAANYELLSAVFLAKADYVQTENYAKKLLLISKGKATLQEVYSKAHLFLGQSAMQRKEYAVSMLHFVKARASSESIQQKYLQAQSGLQIGILYSEVSNYPKALTCFQHIQDQFSFILQTPIIQFLFFNAFGKAHFYARQYEEAQVLFNKVHQHANKPGEKRALVVALSYLSSIYTTQKNFKKALFLAKKANDIIEQIGEDMDGLQVNLINLGNIHYQLGKYSEAIKLTSRGITAAKRLKDELNEIGGYRVMSNIFQKQKDYKNALLYQMIYSKFFEDFFLRNDRQVIGDIEQNFIIENLRKQVINT